MAVELDIKTIDELEEHAEYQFSVRERELFAELLEISSALVIVMPPKVLPCIEAAAKNANQKPEIWAASVLGMASALGAKGVDIFKLVDDIAGLYATIPKQFVNIQKGGGVQ